MNPQRVLTNGSTGQYVGSLEECHGPMRVLGVHQVEGGQRYIIALLKANGDPFQTLSNVRRESLQ